MALDTIKNNFCILAQTRCTCLRAVQTPLGLTLQRFSLGESVQIELERGELLALLRALPTALLLEALGERGLTEDTVYTQVGPLVDTGVFVRVCLNDAHSTYLKLTPAEFAVGKARAQEEQVCAVERAEEVQCLACTQEEAERMRHGVDRLEQEPYTAP